MQSELFDRTESFRYFKVFSEDKYTKNTVYWFKYMM